MVLITRRSLSPPASDKQTPKPLEASAQLALLTRTRIDTGLKVDLQNAATQVETWITNNPGRIVTAGALTGGRFAPGTTVKLTAGVTVGDHCLFASNLGATTATGKAFLAYRSALGGLQPGTTGSTVFPKWPSGPTADATSGCRPGRQRDVYTHWRGTSTGSGPLVCDPLRMAGAPPYEGKVSGSGRKVHGRLQPTAESDDKHQVNRRERTGRSHGNHHVGTA